MRCSHCQTEFQARIKTQRFCSAKCRRAAWGMTHQMPKVRVNADGTVSVTFLPRVPRSERF